MARFAIDAPTLLHIVSAGVRVDPGHQLVAPNTIRSHALTLLLGAVGRGELTDAEAMQRHLLFTQLKIRVLGDRVSRATAWRIARAHGWDTIDTAEYLAVASLQADFLVTVDPVLVSSAAGLVPVASIEALGAG